MLLSMPSRVKGEIVWHVGFEFRVMEDRVSIVIKLHFEPKVRGGRPSCEDAVRAIPLSEKLDSSDVAVADFRL